MAGRPDHGAEAVRIANDLQAILAGRSTVACYLGIGMVIGYMESLAERPDLDGLMRLIKGVAAEEMSRSRPAPDGEGR